VWVILNVTLKLGHYLQEGTRSCLRRGQGMANLALTPQPKTLRTTVGQNRPPAQRTILLVEDHDPLRAMTARTLGEHGYRVLEASDGSAALELLVSGVQVDLVLTDIVMPRMDGYQLAASLRVRCPTVPILFMSGYSDNRFQVPGRFLAKPFTADLLTAEVERLLRDENLQAG
jgi:CheY-like chemotaxis protein